MTDAQQPNAPTGLTLEHLAAMTELSDIDLAGDDIGQIVIRLYERQQRFNTAVAAVLTNLADEKGIAAADALIVMDGVSRMTSDLGKAAKAINAAAARNTPKAG